MREGSINYEKASFFVSILPYNNPSQDTSNAKPLEARLAELSTKMPTEPKHCPPKCEVDPTKCTNQCYLWTCDKSTPEPQWVITEIYPSLVCDACSYPYCRDGNTKECLPNSGSKTIDECNKDCKQHKCDPSQKKYICQDKTKPIAPDCQSVACNKTTGDYYFEKAANFDSIGEPCGTCGVYKCNGSQVDCLEDTFEECQPCEESVCVGSVYECKAIGETECDACSSTVCTGESNQCQPKTEIGGHYIGSLCTETDDDGCTLFGKWKCSEGAAVCDTATGIKDCSVCKVMDTISVPDGYIASTDNTITPPGISISETFSTIVCKGTITESGIFTCDDDSGLCTSTGLCIDLPEENRSKLGGGVQQNCGGECLGVGCINEEVYSSDRERGAKPTVRPII